ncbi:hypothetical protein TWF106_007058 [Orbilia oligospora]|uniref:Peptidase S8/S53 domain-containing protein n=1 Tax=Orbilia oligospora TaxID=2813651 RepID=A0A7C8QR68_ORBOL|nr:hypothetical protein TWF106_007058 [Orbilia oligospora]
MRKGSGYALERFWWCLAVLPVIILGFKLAMRPSSSPHQSWNTTTEAQHTLNWKATENSPKKQFPPFPGRIEFFPITASPLTNRKSKDRRSPYSNESFLFNKDDGEGDSFRITHLNYTSRQKRAFRNEQIPAGTLLRLEPDWGFRMISQPPGQPDTEEYYYERTEGRSNHTFIYVVDQSFLVDHNEFRHNPLIEFLPRDRNPKHNPALLVDSSHGTAVLSKIIGWNTGTARYANVIAVPVLSWGQDGLTALQDLIIAYQRVFDDMERRATKAKERGEIIPPRFIITTALGYYVNASNLWPTERYDTYAQLHTQLNKTMLRFGGRKDALLVIANPNDEDEPRSWWPHNIVYGWKNRFPNAILVSGVDEMGEKIDPELRVPATYAPAIFLRSALVKVTKDKNNPDVITGLKDGGVAAPMISGILANFLADGNLTVIGAKRKLDYLGYARGLNHHSSINPPVVWNGQMSPAKGPKAPFPLKLLFVCNKGTPTNGQPELRTLASILFPVASGQATPKKAAETVSVTITRCDVLGPNSGPVPSTPAPTPILKTEFTSTPMTIVANGYLHDENLCKFCKKADGKVAIDGVIYVPKDCPCR